MKEECFHCREAVPLEGCYLITEILADIDHEYDNVNGVERFKSSRGTS